MSYTIQDTTSKTDSDGDNILEVNVMKAQNAGHDYFDEAYQWVEDAVLQVYNGGWVPDVIVRKITTDQTFDGCDNYVDQGNNWLNNNGWGDGTYCWITECEAQFAGADTGGWSTRRQAWSGTNWAGRSPEYVACIAIMESFHPYLNNNCTEAQKVMGDVSSSNDHSLGKRNSNAENTPMLGTYGMEEATAGDCSNWTSYQAGLTKNLTECTKKALHRSYNHAEGNH